MAVTAVGALTVAAGQEVAVAGSPVWLPVLGMSSGSVVATVGFTGDTTDVRVPAGAASVRLDAIGGSGGATLCDNGGFGGGGTQVIGTVAVSGGQTLRVAVGGHGGSGVEAAPGGRNITAGGIFIDGDSTNYGGFSGGGVRLNSSSVRAGAGGAGTVIAAVDSSDNSKAKALIIAAGGGGAGACIEEHGGWGGSNGDGHNGGNLGGGSGGSGGAMGSVQPQYWAPYTHIIGGVGLNGGGGGGGGAKLAGEAGTATWISGGGGGSGQTYVNPTTVTGTRITGTAENRGANPDGKVVLTFSGSFLLGQQVTLGDPAAERAAHLVASTGSGVNTEVGVPRRYTGLGDPDGYFQVTLPPINRIQVPTLWISETMPAGITRSYSIIVNGATIIHTYTNRSTADQVHTYPVPAGNVIDGQPTTVKIQNVAGPHYDASISAILLNQ